jgi:hypothetical protein
MRVALLRFDFGWIVGIIDEADSAILSSVIGMADEEPDEDRGAVVTLSLPAEVQPVVQPVPGKLEGQIVMTGTCYVVWMHVSHIRVDLSTVVAGDAYDVSDIATDGGLPPLVAAYLATLRGANVAPKDRPARIRVG